MKILTWMLILVVAGDQPTTATEVTLCNCTETKNLGLLNFKDEPDCHLGTKLQQNSEVEYSIYTSEEPQLHFTGHICSVWTKRITTDVYFFGGRDTVRATIPRNIYGNDCWHMHKTLDCFGNQMQRVANEWRFEKEPEQVSLWMTTQVVDIQNCVIEEVKLTQDCEGCPINSPIGTLGNDSQTAEATHNHITIVWDNSKAKHKRTCEVIEIERGTGHLFNSTQDDTLRIQDNRRQLEFWAVKPDVPPCNQDHLLQLTMDKKLFISYRPTGGPALQDKRYQNQTLDDDRKLILENAVQRRRDDTYALIHHLGAAAHVQFTRHLVRMRENVLAEEIEANQCQIRHNKHLATISTAQYDGWLAASHLGLPICQKIIRTGQFAIVKQCKPQQVNISMVMTECGPQPRWKNWTIAATGWELTPASACYWRDNIINIRGTPYEYRNNHWTKLSGTITVNALKLIHSFDAEADLTYMYNPQTKDTHGQDADHINVMADIISIMHENKDTSQWNNAPEIHRLLVKNQEIHNVPYLSSWIHYFKIIGLTTAIAGGLYLFFIIGGAMCIKICIQYLMFIICSKQARSITNEQEETIELQEMV